MNNLQKIGGIASLIAAATILVAIVLFASVLAPDGYEDLEPNETVDFLINHQTIMHLWYLIGYVVFGLALVVLTLALHDRLKTDSPPILVQSATTFGLIWVALVIASGMIANTGLSTVIDLYDKDPAQATTVWQALDAVINGIGGGDELVGGLWILLVSWAALRTRALPHSLNYCGAVISVAGILTVIPDFEMVEFVFGLGLIVWHVWLGIIMLRNNNAPTATA